MNPITKYFPDEIWPQIELFIDLKGLNGLVETCRALHSLFNLRIKIAKVFFDLFCNLQQAHYHYRQQSLAAVLFDETKLTNTVIYVKIDRTLIPNNLNQTDSPFYTTTKFYESLLKELPKVYQQLKTDVKEDTQADLIHFLLGSDKSFEEATQFFPLESFREVAQVKKGYAHIALPIVKILDGAKDADFFIVPSLDKMETWYAINTHTLDPMDMVTHYTAKILSLEVKFRNDFCQRQIADASTIFNEKLNKSKPSDVDCFFFLTENDKKFEKQDPCVLF